MKRTLQILALTLAAGGGATWLVTGAHRGWTQTSIPVVTLDEVTGIEATAYEPGFVAGVDFLGAALLGATLLIAGSFAFPNSKPKPDPS